METRFLADHLDLAPTLARWHGAEWAGLLPNWGYQPALDELLTHTHRNQIPLTVVALEREHLLGSVSLIAEDLPGWEHLTPWLASVFVAPAARGRGIGSQLVDHATSLAAELGFPRLHLFTGGQETFYQRLGWRALAASQLGSHQVTVMFKDLPPAARPSRLERHHS